MRLAFASVHVPKIKPILHIHDPMALPIAMSVVFCIVAIADTENSGSVVAALTMVAPIITFGICVASAIFTAASVNQSAPLLIRATAKAKSNRFQIFPITSSRNCQKTDIIPVCTKHTEAFTLPLRIVHTDTKVKDDLLDVPVSV